MLLILWTYPTCWRTFSTRHTCLQWGTWILSNVVCMYMYLNVSRQLCMIKSNRSTNPFQLNLLLDTATIVQLGYKSFHTLHKHATNYKIQGSLCRGGLRKILPLCCIPNTLTSTTVSKRDVDILSANMIWLCCANELTGSSRALMQRVSYTEYICTYICIFDVMYINWQ